ncbi:hypothetical protein [Legionella yabuuchiae]|uniref:hypothetical protein n=1 Tax=Legionella yabuuchiae TaxID=376727 RepID=UPI001054BF26|nr:hypothetical protein [Legionella yabuuchiae]
MMDSFFSALNPVSSNSGITFRATKHPYSENLLQQNMPDLTLDLVIPFLWSRNLSILDGIYETFSVFYGDHFDKNYRGFGQKGILDFTLLPLLSRKLIADTYLEERKDSHFLNFLAWAVALPIKAITFGVALAFTIAITPIVIGITILRCLFPGSPPPPPPGGAGAADAAAMVLSTQAAYAALHVALHRLELMEIRNPNNIRRLLQEPQNLALVYAMERLTHVVNEDGYLIGNQEIFDFLLEHRTFWTDVRIIENLDGLRAVNQPFVRFDQLQREVARPVARIAQDVNGPQSTHTASVHNSTSKSATRLQECYKSNATAFNTVLDISIAQRVRCYDKNLVGQRSDQEILDSLNSAINKLVHSAHTDATSGVSSRLLLQYCWAAVHDLNQWREGVTQETAEACFYAALYEVDREYALSESGVDNGQSGSHQACASGTFNKMIEGMAKINKLCEVNFITPATAALQLPCVVRQVLKEYLAENFQALEQIKNEGLSAVWSELQPCVLEEMQRNFSAIYPSASGHINPNLLALVEAGEYTDLTQDLQMLEQQAQQKSASQQTGEREMMMC